MKFLLVEQNKLQKMKNYVSSAVNSFDFDWRLSANRMHSLLLLVIYRWARNDEILHIEALLSVVRQKLYTRTFS